MSTFVQQTNSVSPKLLLLSFFLLCGFEIVVAVVIADDKALEEAHMSKFEEVDSEAFESLFGFVSFEENGCFGTFVDNIGDVEVVEEVELGVLEYFC